MLPNVDLQLRPQAGEILALFRHLMALSSRPLPHALVMVQSFAMLFLPAEDEVSAEGNSPLGRGRVYRSIYSF